MPDFDNTYFMQIAIDEAKKSLETGDVPIGAVITYKNEIIAQAHNRIEELKDPLAHAEVLAIKEAVVKYGHKHLIDCSMYISLEPCSMCAGAIVLARIDNVYIAARDPKTGACGSLFNIISDERLNHRCNVEYDILGEQSSAMLKDFFKSLRAKKKNGN